MEILFIGDLVGKPGRQALAKALPSLRAKYKPDLVIANGENAASGFGITGPVMQELFGMGVGVITTGNHAWDKKDTEKFIDNDERLIRPANFPPGAPGRGFVIVPVAGHNIAVVNLQGRIMMPPNDCPFRTMDRLLEEIRDVNAIVVDFHAEATSEKETFGHYFDGRVAAIVGTHTHVQTADERILSKGTAYITDLGMTGGMGGVIGNNIESVLDRFLLGLPHKLEPEKADPVVMGVSVEISPGTGLAVGIERFQEHV